MCFHNDLRACKQRWSSGNGVHYYVGCRQCLKNMWQELGLSGRWTSKQELVRRGFDPDTALDTSTQPPDGEPDLFS